MVSKSPETRGRPRQNRTGKPVQVYLEGEELEQLLSLAERNLRTVSAEVRRALQRHLAEPEVLVVQRRAEGAGNGSAG